MSEVCLWRAAVCVPLMLGAEWVGVCACAPEPFSWFKAARSSFCSTRVSSCTLLNAGVWVWWPRALVSVGACRCDFAQVGGCAVR